MMVLTDNGWLARKPADSDGAAGCPAPFYVGRTRTVALLGIAAFCCVVVMAAVSVFSSGPPQSTSEFNSLGRLQGEDALQDAMAVEPGDGDPQAVTNSSRKGSFIVIGDWGYDHAVHGNVAESCQRRVSDKMLETFRELGDVKFILNVGDSFYPAGVVNKADPQWEIKWRLMYAPELRSVPWYSVYGNHDFHLDSCICEDDADLCALVNYDIDNTNFFFMPGINWYHEHPELDLEVIGLELSHYMWGFDRLAPMTSRFFLDCQITLCPMKCRAFMEKRAEEAMDLYNVRYANSTAKNLLVFSHYPTDYLWSRPEFLDALRDNSSHHVEYFGGHRHNVDQTSTISTYPNNNWLAGGGGGTSCDGDHQGFVVGEIDADSNITTYGVFVEGWQCCTR